MSKTIQEMTIEELRAESVRLNGDPLHYAIVDATKVKHGYPGNSVLRQQADSQAALQCIRNQIAAIEDELKLRNNERTSKKAP